METTGKKISELEERTELSGGEYIPFADNGSNGKIRLSTAFKNITLLTETRNIPSEIIPALSIAPLNTGSITSDQFTSLKKLLNDNNDQLGYIVNRSEIVDNDPAFGIIFVILYYNSDSDTIHLTVAEFGRSNYRLFSNTGEMIAVANDYDYVDVDDVNLIHIKVSKSDNLDYNILPVVRSSGKNTEFLNQIGGITDIQPIYDKLTNISERLAILESYHDGGAIN